MSWWFVPFLSSDKVALVDVFKLVFSSMRRVVMWCTGGMVPIYGELASRSRMVGRLWPLWRLFGTAPVFRFLWPITFLEPLGVSSGFSHGCCTLRFLFAFPLTTAKAFSVTVIVSRFSKMANGIAVRVLVVTVSSFVHVHIPVLVVDFLITVGSVRGWLLCRW